ncbi:MAG: energy transducer TonB [Acidobacteria bacterium]|nr:energy transducer TonB [Acidobacteriota bacterium]
MFDQLVETETQIAEVSSRRNYFIISSVGLGAILLATLIISIFAVDLNLELNDLDMVELLAPVDVTDQKLPDLKTAPKAGGGSQKAAIREVAMARIDETPREIPTAVSTAKNTSKERPSLSRFELGKVDTDSVGGAGSGRGNGSGDGVGDGDGLGDGLSTDTTASAAGKDAETAPPPKVKPVERPVVVSKGVVNSLATSLPKPTIPPAARVANAAGTVAVQVLVDEKGNVVSAKAVSGNALLRGASEVAARSARFTPTLLSGTPIKISGVISYHFNADGVAD